MIADDPWSKILICCYPCALTAGELAADLAKLNVYVDRGRLAFEGDRYAMPAAPWIVSAECARLVAVSCSFEFVGFSERGARARYLQRRAHGFEHGRRKGQITVTAALLVHILEGEAEHTPERPVVACWPGGAFVDAIGVRPGTIRFSSEVGGLWTARGWRDPIVATVHDDAIARSEAACLEALAREVERLAGR